MVTCALPLGRMTLALLSNTCSICQMSSGAAREHVRVARALRDLPVIRADFAAARIQRRLAWRFEDDGSLAGSFRLPPEMFQWLAAACADATILADEPQVFRKLGVTSRRQLARAQLDIIPLRGCAVLSR
jgi:hypothetical protein